MPNFTSESYPTHHPGRNEDRLRDSRFLGAQSHHPKPQTIRNILAYSKALEVKTSRTIESVNVVLN